MKTHNLFCPCKACEKMWADLEMKYCGDVEAYDYEHEKELDQLYELDPLAKT